jgi:protein phosphatase
VPDVDTVPVSAGSRMLLCSDGLTKEITDVGIEHFLENTATAEEAASELLKHALENSGRDNITVIVIDVLAVTPPGQTG